jgi:hypothetical protein
MDPETGEILLTPADTVAIASDFPTVFTLKIEVKNCKSAALSNIRVTDIIKNTIAPGDLDENGVYDYETNRPDSTLKWEDWGVTKKDEREFGFQKLTWGIGELEGGEVAYLKIWLVTSRNPSERYTPTSGDEGDEQEIEINEGVKVTAFHDFGVLETVSPGISINIVDDGVEDNGMGLIQEKLPYTTNWSKDTYP